MLIPGAHIETIGNPLLYSPAQIDRAAGIAHAIQRGKFVLAEPPAKQRPE